MLPSSPVLPRRLGSASALAALLLVTGCGGGGTGRADPAGSPSASTTGASTSSTTSASATSPANPHVADAQQFTGKDFGDGQVRQTVLVGARSGVTMTVWVWTPPQYDDPRYAHSDFPVLFLYPGGDGASYNNWTDRSYSALDVVRTGSANGSVLPFVLVMPEMQVSKDLDTECTDLPGEPAVGTFLDTDVPTMVRDDFRVTAPGRGWGTAGASSGAYCAAAIALRHPEDYGAVVSIAGYFDMETNLPQRKDPAVQALYPTALAAQGRAGFPVLLLAGTASPDDVTRAQRFAQLLRPPATAEVSLQQGGQHLTTSFKAVMPQVFAFFSRHLSGPTPS
ncbi:esterase family protein [Kineococcus sp. NBC_00420]|uniref:alpha/beta hydrolase n=1 Tax=Kineococcus sp. NBC_00420 TaxID=2903564 RepID=UPI002E1B420A